MATNPTTEEADVLNKLVETYNNLEKMEPETVKEVLLQAVKAITTLRALVNISDEMMLEDIEPEGNA